MPLQYRLGSGPSLLAPQPQDDRARMLWNRLPTESSPSPVDDKHSPPSAAPFRAPGVVLDIVSFEILRLEAFASPLPTHQGHDASNVTVETRVAAARPSRIPTRFPFSKISCPHFHHNCH